MQTNQIVSMVSSFIAEKGPDLDVGLIEGLVNFSTWASARAGEELFEPGGRAQETRSFAADDRERDEDGQFTSDNRQGGRQDDNEPDRNFQVRTRHSQREIDESVQADYIVSFENGRRYKTMKRHIGDLGMTPDEYRAKHGLPEDYPMTAPNFSQRRAEIAKQMGLGGSRRREDNRSGNQRQRGGQPGNNNARRN